MTGKLTLTILGGMVIGCTLPVQAQVWNEYGDAGTLPPNAQITVGFGSLRDIRGEALAPNDVDLYAINIMNPQDFSATTLPPPGSLAPPPGTLHNPVLYLFDARGHGVYANDNVDAQNPESLLPASDPRGPVSPGLYFLAIAPFDNRPLGRGVSLFGNIGGVGIFGPASTNPVDAWSSSTLPDGGDYHIHLTGAGFAVAVPEPGTLALVCGFGLTGLCQLRRIRRR